MLRRTLLGLVTALIVARPLVGGEDPGLLDPLGSPGGLVLTFLWLVAALGWAGWRVWARQETWQLSVVEVGLLAVAGFVSLSVNLAARYQHPAWIIAWEWLALLVAFWLVRQLARTPEDNRGLLAALLATGISLSAYAIFQYAVGPVKVPETLTQPYGLDPLGGEWQGLEQERQAVGTFVSRTSFGGYLALLLPPLVGGAMVCWRGRPGSWQAWLIAGCVLLVGTALLLTQSGPAVLGCLVAGAGVVLLTNLKAETPNQRYLTLGVFLIVSLLLFLAVSFLFVDLRSGFASWKAAWDVARSQPLLGVGPGNFERNYPASLEKVQLPSNFALEVWATSGLLALAALAAAVWAFFRTVVSGQWSVVSGQKSGARSQGSGVSQDTGGPSLTPDSWPLTPVRGEFYLGGMAGLILAFFLRVLHLPAQDILAEGWVGGARALIWFPAFALLFSIVWSGRSYTLALTTGVAALLLNLLFANGISFPSVAQPLWVLAALTLNSVGPPSVRWHLKSWLATALAVPISAALTAVYLILVFVPVTGRTTKLYQARQHYKPYQQWRQQNEYARVLPIVMAGFTPSPTTGFPANIAWTALHPSYRGVPVQIDFLNQLEDRKRVERIVRDLLIPATLDDPSDAEAHAELAYWLARLWELQPTPEILKEAQDQAKRAKDLDPEGRAGYLALYSLHRMLAQDYEAKAKIRPADKKEAPKYEQLAAELRREARIQYELAADQLAEIVKRNRRDARLHYHYAEALFQAGLSEQAKSQARKALELDQQVSQPGHKLTDPQREQIRKWLEPPPPG